MYNSNTDKEDDEDLDSHRKSTKKRKTCITTKYGSCKKWVRPWSISMPGVSSFVI